MPLRLMAALLLLAVVTLSACGGGDTEPRKSADTPMEGRPGEPAPAAEKTEPSVLFIQSAAGGRLVDTIDCVPLAFWRPVRDVLVTLRLRGETFYKQTKVRQSTHLRVTLLDDRLRASIDCPGHPALRNPLTIRAPHTLRDRTVLPSGSHPLVR